MYVVVHDMGVGDELQVVDVSNPANPVVRGAHPVSQNAKPVRASGNYVYVSDEFESLFVLDVSDSAHSALASQHPRSGNVRVAGNYIYLAGGGLFILTVPALQAAPATLTWLAEAGGPDPAPGVVSVTSTGRPLTWTAVLSPTVGWLAAAPLSGVTPAAITVTAHITGLAGGSYPTQLVISGATGLAGRPTIPVTLFVADKVHRLYLPLAARGYRP